jgi:RNA polymerase-binding transcription factor DksA
LLTRLDVITKANLQKLSVEGAWKLLTLPVDNPERLLAYTEVVIQGGGLRIPQWGNARNMDLQEAENAAALARDTMAFTRAFGDGLGVSHEDCRLLEQAACAQIIKLLPDEVKENTYGICNSCSKPCPPWFDTCQSCYNSRGSYGYDFDNWW